MKKITKKFKNVQVEITFADFKEYDAAKGIGTGNVKGSSSMTAKRQKRDTKKKGGDVAGKKREKDS